MLFKAKLLLSLGIIGVVAATSSGIYYIQNIDSIEDSEPKADNSGSGLAENQNLPANPILLNLPKPAEQIFLPREVYENNA